MSHAAVPAGPPRVTAVRPAAYRGGVDRAVGGAHAAPEDFDAACAQVLDYLTDAVPMGAWAVTRVVGETQLFLDGRDSRYGFVTAGAEFPWHSSMCRSMSAGRSPRVSPDTGALPALAEQNAAAAAAQVEVGAYIGTPITSPDGSLFGTVCGYNPEALEEVPDGLESLLDLLSTLLSVVLEADVATTASRRELERVAGEAETDALTGLLNRRGWDRWTAREEPRLRRLGDPASVVVVDLDLLKVVNDTHGHEAGDAYLRRAADVLRRAVDGTGAVARLGGDEFALVDRKSTRLNSSHPV